MFGNGIRMVSVGSTKKHGLELHRKEIGSLGKGCGIFLCILDGRSAVDEPKELATRLAVAAV